MIRLAEDVTLSRIYGNDNTVVLILAILSV